MARRCVSGSRRGRAALPSEQARSSLIDFIKRRYKFYVCILSAKLRALAIAAVKLTAV